MTKLSWQLITSIKTKMIFMMMGITSEARTYCTAFLSTSRTPSSTGYKKDYKEWSKAKRKMKIFQHYQVPKNLIQKINKVITCGSAIK